MQFRKYVLLSLITAGPLLARAQDITEAFNLSNQTVQGTARSMGFGNALGSVGGDFSSLSVNPAGLGVYRSSELTFTPSLSLNSINSIYLNTSSTDNSSKLNINNFGLVFTNAPKGARYDSRNWKSVSFAFGVNKMADFHRSYNYSGTNYTGSASQMFESDANLYPGNDTFMGSLAYMGYQSYLINQDSASGLYKTIVPFSHGVNQLKTIEEGGYIHEYVISLGGNYKEVLMLGATLGIPTFNYWRNSSYSESLVHPSTNNPDNFNNFNYSSALSIYGQGVNLKFGAIYKVSDNFRIGASFHSPTYYSITDNFDPTITANAQGHSTSLKADNGLYKNTFDYNFSTPWKGILSATLLVKNFGFLTFDYEYVDYTTMRYKLPSGVDDNGNSFLPTQNALNNEIKKVYQPASYIKIGGELKLTKFFMARAGFGYYGDAYSKYGEENSANSYTTQRIDLSAGLGFRFEHFFTDFGLVHSTYTGYEKPYSVDYSGVTSGSTATVVPTAKVDYVVNNLALTLGFKF